jgi:hypothetical protein
MLASSVSGLRWFGVLLVVTVAFAAWRAWPVANGAADEAAGEQIPPSSVLGRAVNAVLDDLSAQYLQPRREAIGSIDLRLATTEPGAIYRVRIAGERLTVKHGQRLLVDEQVEAEALVDLVDKLLEGGTVARPDLAGVLLMHGRSVPITLVGPGRGPFEQIYRAIRNAEYREEQAREAAAE